MWTKSVDLSFFPIFSPVFHSNYLWNCSSSLCESMFGVTLKEYHCCSIHTFFHSCLPYIGCLPSRANFWHQNVLISVWVHLYSSKPLQWGAHYDSTFFLHLMRNALLKAQLSHCIFHPWVCWVAAGAGARTFRGNGSGTCFSWVWAWRCVEANAGAYN